MNALKRLRAESGLTLEELAEKSGVNINTISYLENGKQKARSTTLAKVARALGVPLDDLAELIMQPRVESPNSTAA